MAGQDPYRPFENDKVTWIAPESEGAQGVAGARPSDDLAQKTPGLFLFLSGQDTTSCCAANYERFVFRDRRVLDLSRSFVTMRIDRTGAPEELLQRLGVRREKPAIVLTDGDGLVRARFDACTSAKDVVEAMQVTLRAAALKARVAERARELFKEAAVALERDGFRDAGVVLRKILRLEDTPFAALPRAERELAAIAARGETELASARALEDLTVRYDRLLHLRHEFWDFAVVDPIKADVVELEEGETTKQLIFEHRAATLLAQAEALLEAKDTAKGRGLLRKVRRDFEGTQAAARAATLLE